MLDPTFAALVAIVLLAFTIEAMAGFGSIVISLTLASHLYSINELLPVLVPLNLMLVIYMVTRHRGHVAGKLIGFRVLPFMCAGVAVGLAIYSLVEGPELKFGFGVLVVVLSLVELWKLFGQKAVASRPWSWVNNAYVHAAGIIHGIYATGGPLLVYALGRSQLPKSTLRSSLALIWLTMDLVLTTTFLIQGRLDATAGKRIAILAPVVIVAIVLGELGHGRIRETPFRKLVFALLLGAGVSLLF